MVDTCLMVLEFEQNPMAGLDREYSVYVEHTELEVISVGEQGPPGPPGPPSPGSGDAPLISTDPYNRLAVGSDNGLYVRDDLNPDPLAYYILAKG